MSSPTADPDDLALALALADDADDITQAAFRRRDLAVDTKPDLTPVTVADRAVEDAIRGRLDKERPSDAVLGEEGGEAGASNRRWIIDPIDGTKNFVRGIPVWATLIALEVDGVTSLGVASAPMLGRRWWAGRSRGAFAGPAGGATTADGAAPIQVSGVSRLDEAQVSGASLSGWQKRGGLDRAVTLALACYRDRNFGDFWSHVLVAEGCCDIALDPVVSLWDLAALQVIVEEAGGCFTDLDGNATPGGGSAVSTNGLLHDEVLEILRA